VLQCDGCEGRSTAPLHSRSVRCDKLNFRTAGNKDFSAYYTNSDIGKRSDRCDSPLDVVPHAWKAEDLKQIPALYLPQIDVQFLAPLITGISLLAAGAQFEHVNPQSAAKTALALHLRFKTARGTCQILEDLRICQYTFTFDVCSVLQTHKVPARQG
jgi:hypothetical protein